jgi:hypothetical protein
MIFVRTTIIENGVTEATGFFFSMHLGISLNLGYLRKSQRSKKSDAFELLTMF